MRFPEDISYGCKVSTNWANDKVQVKSGKLKTIQNWDSPLYRFDVSKNVQTQAKYEAFLTFFNEHAGDAIPFRFKNWAEYQCPINRSYITRPTTETLLLWLTYGAYNRQLTKIVSNTFKLYANGVLVTSGYTLDIDTGIVTLQTPANYPSNTVFTFSCEFDIWCVFESPTLTASIDNYGVYNFDNIGLIEWRE